MAWPSEEAFYPQDWMQRVQHQLRAIAKNQGLDPAVVDTIEITLDGPTSKGAQVGFRLEAPAANADAAVIITQFTQELQRANSKVNTETAYRVHPRDFNATLSKMETRRTHPVVDRPHPYVNGTGAHAMLATGKGLAL